MLTQPQARKLTDAVLSAGKKLAKDAALSVSVQTGRAANTRFARSEITSTGDVDDTVLTVEVGFGKRHAQASTMRIRIAREGDRLTLVASDDGVGMAADRPRDTDGIGLGLGLRGLAKRLEALGGALRLPPAAKGLTLELQVDLAGRMTRREPA